MNPRRGEFFFSVDDALAFFLYGVLDVVFRTPLGELALSPFVRRRHVAQARRASPLTAVVVVAVVTCVADVRCACSGRARLGRARVQFTPVGVASSRVRARVL